VIEREYPILFRKYELRQDSGAPGMYRGGLGIIRSFTVLDDEVVVTIFAERGVTRPWGLNGGKPAHGFKAMVTRATGETIQLKAKQTVKLSKGDTLTIYTPGGGGYGDPCKRDRRLVEKDLLENRISKTAASREYCFNG